MRFFATALSLFLVLQSALGALTVLSRKDVVFTTAHVATGATLLVVSVLMTLHVFKYKQFAWRQEPAMDANHSEALA